MSIITLILAGIVALEHLYIMYLETFATHSDTTSRVFNMSKEELQRDSVTNLFKNQGIYNGLIAIFLLYGIFTNSQLLVTVFVLNVFFAAIYGAITANKKIILTQGGLSCTPKVRQKKSNFRGVFIMKLTYEDKVQIYELRNQGYSLDQ
ncbi:DUF1304 domain-containing protein, partial [Streptococcus salivarius]|uniref:DUF1304 domain-containing protein n=3 Tax=Streptococcus TaxID=1301 RepID=UPI0039C3244F